MKEILALVGVIISVLAGLYTFRITNWSKSVSESRNRWINDFRNEISTIVATLKIIKYCSEKNNGEKCNCNESYFLLNKIYQAEASRARLLTKLNTSNIIDNSNNFPLKKILESIKFKYLQITFDNKIHDNIDDKNFY